MFRIANLKHGLSGDKKINSASLLFDAGYYSSGGVEFTAQQVGLNVIESVMLEDSQGYTFDSVIQEGGASVLVKAFYVEGVTPSGSITSTFTGTPDTISPTAALDAAPVFTGTPDTISPTAALDSAPVVSLTTPATASLDGAPVFTGTPDTILATGYVDQYPIFDNTAVVSNRLYTGIVTAGAITVTPAVTVAGVNENQLLEFSDEAASGSFIVMYDGVASPNPVGYNAALATVAADIETELRTFPGLAAITVAPVGATWVAGFDIAFVGVAGNADAVSVDSGLLLDAGGTNITNTVTVSVAHVVEIQEVPFNAVPTEGAFTLTYGAWTTNAINYYDDNAVVEAELRALDVSLADVTVAGSFAAGAFDVTFTGVANPVTLLVAPAHSLAEGVVVGSTLLQAVTAATANVIGWAGTFVDVDTVVGTFDATEVVTGTNPSGLTYTFTPAELLIDVWTINSSAFVMTAVSDTPTVLTQSGPNTALLATYFRRVLPTEIETLNSDGWANIDYSSLSMPVFYGNATAYTPVGAVSTPSISVVDATYSASAPSITVTGASYTPAGTNDTPTITVTGASYTPAGTNSASFTGAATPNAMLVEVDPSVITPAMSIDVVIRGY